MQAKLFISYRRQDSQDVTGRIYDRLVAKYGDGTVFKDVDAIPAGVDFREHLAQVLHSCDVVLAVIGRSWTSVRDEHGQARLQDEEDFLRIEIEAAHAAGIHVIPVLVQNAEHPREIDLPSNLAFLAHLQGLQVRPDPDFHRDVTRLCEAIDRLLAQPREAREPFVPQSVRNQLEDMRQGRLKLEEELTQTRATLEASERERQQHLAELAAAKLRAETALAAEEIDALRNEARSQRLKAEGMRERLVDLEFRAAEYEDQVLRAYQALRSQDKAFAGLDAELARAERSMARLGDAVATKNRRILELTERIGRYQAILGEFEGEAGPKGAQTSGSGGADLGEPLGDE